LDRLLGAGGEAERQDDGAPEQPLPGEARPHTFATHRAQYRKRVNTWSSDAPTSGRGPPSTLAFSAERF
jgi:hypothetical protein